MFFVYFWGYNWNDLNKSFSSQNQWLLCCNITCQSWCQNKLDQVELRCCRLVAHLSIGYTCDRQQQCCPSCQIPSLEIKYKNNILVVLQLRILHNLRCNCLAYFTVDWSKLEIVLYRLFVLYYPTKLTVNALVRPFCCVPLSSPDLYEPKWSDLSQQAGLYF